MYRLCKYCYLSYYLSFIRTLTHIHESEGGNRKGRGKKQMIKRGRREEKEDHTNGKNKSHPKSVLTKSSMYPMIFIFFKLKKIYLMIRKLRSLN